MRILLLFGGLLTVICLSKVNGQCNGMLKGSITVPNIVGKTITTDCINTGMAITITGLIAGNTYRFDNCIEGKFDSELSLWEVGQKTNLAYNDNNCSSTNSGYNSSIIFSPISSNNVELVLTSYGCTTNVGQCAKIDITLIKNIPIPPFNDKPCSAKLLKTNILYSFANINATTDKTECNSLKLSLGNCITGWCDAGIQNSIWFTFVAPISGYVEINACNEGTTFDTQMAVFSAINCNDYSSFTYVAANDDGIRCEQNKKASYLAIDSLVADKTYYLLVDGYGGRNGAIELIINKAIIEDRGICPKDTTNYKGKRN